MLLLVPASLLAMPVWGVPLGRAKERRCNDDWAGKLDGAFKVLKVHYVVPQSERRIPLRECFVRRIRALLYAQLLV